MCGFSSILLVNGCGYDGYEVLSLPLYRLGLGFLVDLVSELGLVANELNFVVVFVGALPHPDIK